MRRLKWKVTTAADGSATVFSPRTSGLLHSLHYLPDGTNPYPNTVDMTITAEATGEAIASRSNIAAAFSAYPRVPTTAPDGTASAYAAAGEAVRDKVGLANDRIKVVLAQGGNAKTGTFIALVD
jgi:hypothetical protein